MSTKAARHVGPEFGKRAVDRRTAMAVAGASGLISLSPPLLTEAEAYDPGGDETRPRYRADAPDVQAFYRTNGYETLKKQ